MNKNIFLILLILFVSGGLFGQYIWQYIYKHDSLEPEIIDGRAKALGSTSILSSSGANYVFNNPAMLSSLESIDLQFNLRTQLGKTKTSSTMSDTIYYDTDRSCTDFTRTFHYKINGLAFGIPYKMSENSNWKFGFAAGYRTYYDWGYNLHQEVNTSYEPAIEDEYIEYNGGFNTLVFGSGINYKKKIFGGFSISLPFLSEYSEIFENYDGSEEKNSGTLKGTFLTLSWSYILNNYLKVGVRFRTKYNLENEVENFLHNHHTYKYTIPAEYGFALEVKPHTDIKIFTEYLTCKFSDYKNVYFIHSETKDGYSFRTGIELGSRYLLRCGFFRQSVPVYKLIPHYNEITNVHCPKIEKKPQVETGFTAGFGSQIQSRIQLSLFCVYSFLKYKESFALYSPGFQNYVDITNDVSYYLFKIGCSLGYSF